MRHLSMVFGLIGLLLFMITLGLVLYKYKKTGRTHLESLRLSYVWFVVAILGLGLYFFGDYIN